MAYLYYKKNHVSIRHDPSIIKAPLSRRKRIAYISNNTEVFQSGTLKTQLLLL